MKDVSPNRLSLDIKAMVDRSFSTLLKLCMPVHTFSSSEIESIGFPQSEEWVYLDARRVIFSVIIILSL